ncbi:hypothetical protein GCK72_019210 [Caenorhabditis remanei]|uniref:G-protein coupled receptors family 1 profile domain-containing protein n=1 Tax=Caenorhabditis remanei TaxID=31234 RepID=A0A6A5GDD4_CAERE|nr:hypothetical protein GCK72_019210 [Caenorhabditis remanei]KAF1752655.1 hypothetical protein GCK72_019210 [Caenorhabditis remanei]
MVLSRKSMRNNSVNVWLMATAICDLIMLFWSSYQAIEEFSITHSEVGYECCGYSENFTMTKYGGALDGWMFSYTMMIVVSAIDSIFKIISIFSLPIVTIILIRFLRKAEASRKKLQRNSENSSNDHTTKLVTFMTISLLVSEGPLPIFTLLLTMLEEDIFLMKIVTSIFKSWYLVYTLNSAIHWLICVSMSSQYRNCVKEMFPCLEKRQNRRITIPSPNRLHALVLLTFLLVVVLGIHLPSSEPSSASLPPSFSSLPQHEHGDLLLPSFFSPHPISCVQQLHVLLALWQDDVALVSPSTSSTPLLPFHVQHDGSSRSHQAWLIGKKEKKYSKVTGACEAAAGVAGPPVAVVSTEALLNLSSSCSSASSSTSASASSTSSTSSSSTSSSSYSELKIGTFKNAQNFV